MIILKDEEKDLAKIQRPFMITILSSSGKDNLHGRLGKRGHIVFCCSHQEVNSIFLPLVTGFS